MGAKKIQDVRVMSLSDQRSYVEQVLVRANAIAIELPDGDKLYTVFKSMLQFVVASKVLYAEAGRDKYIYLREINNPRTYCT